MATPAEELAAMTAAYEALKGLDEDQLPRALGWLTDALGVPASASAPAPPPSAGASTPAAAPSDGAAAAPTVTPSGASSPKDFIRDKKPKNGAERIACLAYYLSEFRSTPHFKAPDIVALNTEAAQARIGNPSRDVDNAERGSGYLASAGSGNKQLSTRGEALVLALPDREAVKAALEEHPLRKRAKKAAAKKTATVKAATPAKKAAKKAAKKLPKP